MLPGFFMLFATGLDFPKKEKTRGWKPLGL